jgi:outer membrane protein assembly factor BamA
VKLKNWLLLSSVFTVINIVLILTLPSIGYAQDSSSDSINPEQVTESLAEEESEQPPQSTVISEDMTVIGIVDKIETKGELVTSKSVVIHQLKFKIGDSVSKHDLDMSRNSLLGLNGIYWRADFTWVAADEPGHIFVTIDLSARRTWFVSPAFPAGGAIGDRNVLNSGDSLSLGIFIDSESQNYLYTLSYLDPQFHNGHNSMGLEVHTLETTYSIRTDTEFSTGESYDLARKGFALTYGTRYKKKTSVAIGYRWDDVSALKKGDPFGKLGTDDTFYFSGAEIPDGKVGVAVFDLSSGTMNSRFFPTRGYYWDFDNEMANALTLSDFNFTRHTITAAGFKDIYRGTNVLCGRVMYSSMTGNPPDYEKLPFDWQVRGYSLGTHRGMSLLAANFEYRFIAEPEIFQGVVFADFGRSWDKNVFALSGLEFGYGVGIRIYTAPFIPYNLLLRLDYGWSDTGEEFTFGFNQFF